MARGEVVVEVEVHRWMVMVAEAVRLMGLERYEWV